MGEEYKKFLEKDNKDTNFLENHETPLRDDAFLISDEKKN